MGMWGFCDVNEEQMEELINERIYVNVEMLDDNGGKKEAEQKSVAHEKAEITNCELSMFLGTCASLQEHFMNTDESYDIRVEMIGLLQHIRS